MGFGCFGPGYKYVEEDLMAEQGNGMFNGSQSASRPDWWITMTGMAVAERAAQKAAAVASNPIAAVSAGHEAAAEALSRFTNGVFEGTGRQCLAYPGDGNSDKYFNYETMEWEEDC